MKSCYMYLVTESVAMQVTNLCRYVEDFSFQLFIHSLRFSRFISLPEISLKVLIIQHIKEFILLLKVLCQKGA